MAAMETGDMEGRRDEADIDLFANLAPDGSFEDILGCRTRLLNSL